ncbi:hypothetical protein LTS08_007445 [Lithohypha guttulata]|nr:hypothetical protein LTS08_007445 [Lithohypha guttulata]
MYLLNNLLSALSLAGVSSAIPSSGLASDTLIHTSSLPCEDACDKPSTTHILPNTLNRNLKARAPQATTVTTLTFGSMGFGLLTTTSTPAAPTITSETKPAPMPDSSATESPSVTILSSIGYRCTDNACTFLVAVGSETLTGVRAPTGGMLTVLGPSDSAISTVSIAPSATLPSFTGSATTFNIVPGTGSQTATMSTRPPPSIFSTNGLTTTKSTVVANGTTTFPTGSITSNSSMELTSPTSSSSSTSSTSTHTLPPVVTSTSTTVIEPTSSATSSTAASSTDSSGAPSTASSQVAATLKEKVILCLGVAVIFNLAFTVMF